MECCICKKEIDDDGHDPRPIVSKRGNRCCDDCNKDVVVPTRKEVW